jgi:chemotaxis signal transduction protein
VSQTKPNSSQVGAQVLVFPAQASEVQGKQINFLFSVRQVVDVLVEARVQSVPFGPQYAKGIAEWRGRSLPVLSLEHSLGLKIPEPVAMRLRTIVVRGVHRRNDHDLLELYGIVQVGSAVRKLDLPLPCKPVSAPAWIAESSYLKGIYEWEQRVLLVVDLEKILGVVHMPAAGVGHGL